MFKSQTAIAGVLLLLALLLQGCGRKGPLYMPQAPAKPLSAAPAQPEQIQSAPGTAIPSQITPSQTEPEKFP